MWGVGVWMMMVGRRVLLGVWVGVWVGVAWDRGGAGPEWGSWLLLLRGARDAEGVAGRAGLNPRGHVHPPATDPPAWHDGGEWVLAVRGEGAL